MDGTVLHTLETSRREKGEGRREDTVKELSKNMNMKKKKKKKKIKQN